MDSKPVILDFDDLADGNDRLDILERLKERDPGFKVTLFAIPARCGDALLKRYDERKDWIALGIHGFRHSRHEAMSWTDEETAEKIALARSIYPGFAPVFKAPNWSLDKMVYEGCTKAGVAIADHVRNRPIIPEGQNHYFYNIRIRRDPYVRMHGHIQDWGGTGLEEAFDKWSSPPVGSPYLFVHEAATTAQDVEV